MGWIVPHALTGGERDHMVAVTSPAATVLLGRRNAQGFEGYWPGVAGDESADPRDRAFSMWLQAVEKVVFSTTIVEASWEKSRIVNGDPAEVVEELRRRPGGDIVVLTSASVIKRLLMADAIDRLSITMCPEVVGGGARLFDDGLPESSWVLHQSRPTSSGALCLLYDRVR